MLHHNTPQLPVEAGLTPYHFEGRDIRVVRVADEPWFVAGDAAAFLGHRDAANLTRSLDDDEKGTHSVSTPSGDQGVAVISEAGLYRAIVQRRATSAVPAETREGIARFQRWVFHDVLPMIRKTGSYNAPDPLAALNNASSLRTLLLASAERELALQGQVAEMADKVDAHDRIAEAYGTFCRSTAAKMLGIPPLTLIRWMRTNNWTFRRLGDKDDIAYQAKIAAGLLEHKISTGPRPDGTEWTSTSVRVTAKGMTVLAKAFPPPLALVE